jgi:hypothetical protein
MQIDIDTLKHCFDVGVEMTQLFVAAYLDVILALVLGVASSLAALRQRLYRRKR